MNDKEIQNQKNRDLLEYLLDKRMDPGAYEEAAIPENTFKISVLQLKYDEDNRVKRFRDYESLQNLKKLPQYENYDIIYSKDFSNIGLLNADSTELLHKFYSSIQLQPQDYYGYTLSVGDIVAVTVDNNVKAYFVDDLGFVELKNFNTPSLERHIEYGITVREEVKLLDSLSSVLDPTLTKRKEVIHQEYDDIFKLADERNTQLAIDKNGEFTHLELNSKDSIRYFVAECMEFQNLGEVVDNVQTIEEAYSIYSSLPEDKKNMGNGIGVHVRHNGEMDEYHLLYNNHIDTLENYSEDIQCNPEIIKATQYLNSQINGQMLSYRELVELVYQYEIEKNIPDTERITKRYKEQEIDVSVARHNVSEYMIHQKVIDIIEEKVLESNSKNEILEQISNRPMIGNKDPKDIYSVSVNGNVIEEPLIKVDDTTYMGRYEQENVNFKIDDLEAFWHNDKIHKIEEMSFLNQKAQINEVTHGEEKSVDDIKKETLLRGITDLMDSKEFMTYCDSMNKLMYNNYSPANCNKILNQFIIKYLEEQKIDIMKLDKETLVKKIGEALTSDKKPSFLMGYEAWKQYGRKVTGKGVAYVITAPNYVTEYKGKGSLLKAVKNSFNKQYKENPNLEYAKFNLGNTGIGFHGYRNGLYDITINGNIVKGKLTEEVVRKFLDNEVIGKVPNGFSSTFVYDVQNTEVPEYLWMKKGFTKSEMAVDDKGNPITRTRGKSKEYKIINSEERIAKFNPRLNSDIPELNKEKMDLLFAVLQSVSAKKDIPMTVEKIERDGVGGFFSHKEKRIAISDKLNETEKVSVAFHEMAHSVMHYQKQDLTRELKEVQAEAVAYMTAQNFGIETQTSSFNYIAGWSSGRDVKELEQSLNEILKQSKALTVEIQNELADRNLTMQLEPIVSENNITTDLDFETIAKDNVDMFVEYRTKLHQQQDAAFAKLEVLENERLKNIVKEQIDVFENHLPCIYFGIKGCEVLADPTCDTNKKLEWYDLMKQGEKGLREMDEQIEALSQEYVEYYQEVLHEQKQSLKDYFVHDRYNAIKDFINSSTDEKYKKLTNLEIDYISKSEFLYRTYGRLVSTDLEDFMNVAIKQVENIKKVSSKNNVFVEITMCERWTEESLFKAGTVGHPKNMNTMFAKYEKTIRKCKEEAQKLDKESYIPYHKCKFQIFVPDKDNLKYHSLESRIDIGDGYQKDLTHSLEQLISEGSQDKKLNRIKESYKQALLEKPRKKIREVEEVIDSNTIEKSQSESSEISGTDTLVSMAEIKSLVQHKDDMDLRTPYEESLNNVQRCNQEKAKVM